MTALLLGFVGSGLGSDLKVGDPAPGINLKTDEGTDFDLQSRKGQWTVLYFYPKAETPGAPSRLALSATAFHKYACSEQSSLA